jgi:hypothetical protein
MPRQFLLAGVLLAFAACSPPPMRWEGAGSHDAANDEAACQVQADQQAVRQLPYGNGPPLYGLHSEWSMLTWKQEIDNERYYLARDLMRACMHNKGYQRVPASAR